MSNSATRLPAFLRPVDRHVTTHGVTPRSRTQLFQSIVFGERYVLSRSLLHFERIERPNGRLDQRVRDAIKLAAHSRTPFNDAGLAIVWGQTHALAWSWDRQRLEQLGVPGQAWISVESTSTKPPSDQDGLQLRELQDGYEAQVFRNGELFASRFWGHRPTQLELDMFERSCQSPLPEAASTASTPLSALQEAFNNWQSRLSPLHGLLILAFCLAAPLLHQAGTYLRLAYALDQTRSELATVVQDSSVQFEALQTYQDHLSELESYSATLSLTHPLLPAAELAETAQSIDGSLRRFRITQSGVEAVLFAQSSTDPAEIVRRLQDSQSLTEVSISRGRGQGDWAITATLNLESPSQGDPQ